MSDEDREVGPKEKIYDEQIAPLMTQIIAICKEHGLGMHATFVLDGEDTCHTHIPNTPPHPTLHLMYCLAAARGNLDSFLMQLVKQLEGKEHGSIYLRLFENWRREFKDGSLVKGR